MAGNVYPLRTVEDEASEWIARTEAGCTPEQKQQLELWLGANPEHRAVFEDMVRQWRRVSATAGIAGRLNRAAEQTNRDAGGVSAQSPEKIGPSNERGGRRATSWASRPIAIAASALLGVCGWIYLTQRPVDLAPQVYETGMGAHRTVRLADASVVDLNTATRIEAELSSRQRLVRLTAGEALFQVAPDADRPFLVVAGSSVVRALGTAFAVRIAPGSTKVVVTEGRVLVSPLSDVNAAQPEAPSADADKILGAGEQVSITTAIGRVDKVQAHELDRALAWRRGVLNIQDQPLGEVIAEVERYTTTRFTVADPSLMQIKVGGYFKATDIDAFLTLIEGQFPIRAERESPDSVVLKRRTE